MVPPAGAPPRTTDTTWPSEEAISSQNGPDTVHVPLPAEKSGTIGTNSRAAVPVWEREPDVTIPGAGSPDEVGVDGQTLRRPHDVQGSQGAPGSEARNAADAVLPLPADMIGPPAGGAPPVQATPSADPPRLAPSPAPCLPPRRCAVRRRPVYRPRSVHRPRSLRQRRSVRQQHHQHPRRPGSRFRLLASQCTSTPHPPDRRWVDQIPQPRRLVPCPVVQGPVVQGPVVQGPVVQGPVVQGPVVQGPVVQCPVGRPLRPGLLPRRRLTGWTRLPCPRRAALGPGRSARPRSALARPQLVRRRQRRPAARNWRWRGSNLGRS